MYVEKDQLDNNTDQEQKEIIPSKRINFSAGKLKNQKEIAIYVILAILFISIIFLGVMFAFFYLQKNKEKEISSKEKENIKVSEEINFSNFSLGNGIIIRNGNNLSFIDEKGFKQQLGDFSGLSDLQQVKISPSKEYLIGIKNNQVTERIDLKTGLATAVCEDSFDRVIFNFSFHHLEDKIVYINRNSELIICDVINNKRNVIIKSLRNLNNAIYSPDGTKLLLFTSGGGPGYAPGYGPSTSTAAIINSDGTNFYFLPNEIYRLGEFMASNNIFPWNYWTSDSSSVIFRSENVEGYEVKSYTLSSGLIKTLYRFPKYSGGHFDINNTTSKIIFSKYDLKEDLDVEKSAGKIKNTRNIYLTDLISNYVVNITNFKEIDNSLNLAKNSINGIMWWNNKILFERNDAVWIINEDGSNMKKMYSDTAHTQILLPPNDYSN